MNSTRQPNYCDECGESVEPDKFFCTNCGNQISDTGSQPADNEPKSQRSPEDQLRDLPPDALKRRLQSMDEYDFEYLIADLWKEMGWRTEVSQASVDAGIDVIAEKTTPYKEKKVIQAKRYGEDTTVGGPDIQQYNSLKYQVSNADSVIVVTTSRFSSGAENRAGELNVKLVNGDDLVSMIEDLDAYDHVAKYLETAALVQTTTVSSQSSTPPDHRSKHSPDESDKILGHTVESEWAHEFVAPAESVFDRMPQTDRKSGVLEFLVICFWIITLPFLIPGLLIYYIYAIGENKHGLADILAQSPLGVVPTIQNGGWQSAATLILTLLLLLGMLGGVAALQMTVILPTATRLSLFLGVSAIAGFSYREDP